MLMKYSKTYQLINSLTKKEINKFIRINLKRKKRIKLLKAYISYITNNKEYDIKEFYCSFYKEEYNKKKDNILRNEFRLLNTLLEDFILEKQFEKQNKESYYFNRRLYLSYLLDRNILDLFEKEITKVFHEIDDNEDYFDFYIFFEMWTRFQNKKFSYDSHYFEHSKKFYKQGILKWFKELSFKTRKLELFNSFIERTNQQIGSNVSFTDSIDSIKIINAKDSNYINFINKKILSFKTFDQEKINILIETLSALKKINTKKQNKANEEFGLLQSIGVEYMIHANNKEAAIYFRQVIKLEGKISEDLFVKGLYNYINVEIKIKKFSKAIKVYNDYIEKIEKTSLVNLFKNAISMCYIMLGEIEKAEELTTIISSTISQESNVYSRCIIAIIYFLNGNKELSINELNNINQSLNYYQHKNQYHKDFISNFKKFIHLLDVRFEIKENKEKFKELKQLLTDNMQKSNEEYSGNSLNNLWLINEIEKLM